MIFGEDYKQGPVRLAPPLLGQFIEDWPVHPNDVLTISADAPPRCPVTGFQISFHRVTIVLNGKFEGYALRMGDISLSTLAAYEAAWQNHRQVHAH
jgi:hypothetical protein